MVQNLKFKIFLILALIAGAVVVLAVKPVSLGLDLSGGSSLRYKLPRPPDLSPDRKMSDVLEDTLAVFRKRIQGSGLKDIPIRSQGEDEILIELPGMSEAEVDNIVKIIQSQGDLQWMILAEDETDKDDPSISVKVEDEYKRLAAYLKKIEETEGGWDLGVDLSSLSFEKTINGRKRYYRWYPMAKDVLTKDGIKIPEKGSTMEKLGIDPATGKGLDVYFKLVKKYADPKWQFSGKDLQSVYPSFDRNMSPAVGFEFKAERASDFV